MIGADREVASDVPSQGEEVVLAADQEPGAACPGAGSSAAAAPGRWPFVSGDASASPGDDCPSSQERLPALELVAERFAKAVARHLAALPGGRGEARVVETRQARLDAHLRELPAGSTLSLITAVGWNHDCALQLDERLADALLERVLGGTGSTPAGSRGRSRTAIEERLLARSIQGLLGELGRAFTPVAPIEFRFSGFLPVTAVEEILGPETRCVTVALAIPLASGAGLLGLVFPCAALEPIRERLAATPQSDRAVRDRGWEDRWAKALLSTDVVLDVVLAERTLQLSTVAGLSPGSTLELGLPTDAPAALRCETKLLATGTVGRRADQLVVTVDEALNDLGTEDDDQLPG
jgi:flagellar motor switch protein FliM